MYHVSSNLCSICFCTFFYICAVESVPSVLCEKERKNLRLLGCHVMVGMLGCEGISEFPAK
jgi:hypothetical protein